MLKKYTRNLQNKLLISLLRFTFCQPYFVSNYTQIQTAELCISGHNSQLTLGSYANIQLDLGD